MANIWCEEPEAKPQKTVTITISPETTYITEPLLPDGRVDYYGAINRRLSEGVTCENNIFAGIFSLIPGEEYALIEALHEGRENDPDLKSRFESNTKFRQKYFQMLGLDAAPDLLSLQKLDPTGSFGAANIDLYQQLLKFYPKDEIDAKLEAQKNEEAGYYRNQHKEGKLDDEQLAENLKSLETEKFSNSKCHYLINNEYYYDAMQRIFTEEECPLVTRTHRPGVLSLFCTKSEPVIVPSEPRQIIRATMVTERLPCGKPFPARTLHNCRGSDLLRDNAHSLHSPALFVNEYRTRLS
ncbi:MAG: hypothetical protein FWH27_13680 [Planctomycetaceae bacterium]|nr:hypothetical protein [Planctomycetaceae bacterium]